MQPVGIALIAIGAWVVYCGAFGIDPLKAAAAIIQSPQSFRQVVADAKAEAAAKYSDIIAIAKSVGAGIGKSIGNPFSGFQITDGWDEHRARGSAGGVDFAMPQGTPLPAAFGGTITNIPDDGSGGNTVTITMDNGYKLQYLHVSEFLKKNGDKVTPGTIVAKSGGTPGTAGAGSSTGAHLHVHMIDPNGSRIDFLSYLKG